MSSPGLFQRFEDAHILDGVRTPMVDYMDAFADANPIDLSIKAARAVIKVTPDVAIDIAMTGTAGVMRDRILRAFGPITASTE